MNSFMQSLKLFSLFFLAVSFTQMNSCSNEKKNNSGNNTNKLSQQELNKKFEVEKLKVPPGFSINVYAEVPNARSLCVTPAGTVFVSNRTGTSIYAVRDTNKDGLADIRYEVVKDFDTPNGVAFKEGTLYFATVSSIYKLEDIEKRLANPPSPVLVYKDYPTDGHHGWKFIAFGPDGKLYVPVGAPCNVCEKKDPIYSTITRINPDGTGKEIFASGVRNSVGFAWHPVTKELWFTDNGRDNMGDDLPDDELNRAPVKGMHFGFPYIHQGNIKDPEFGEGKDSSMYTTPAKNLGPHVAALGMRFYTGNMFLPEYKNQAFIALHGSWNRSKKSGYKVMLARINDKNEVVQYMPFAEGWLQPEEEVIGRPVDVDFLPDGSMLISSDNNGVVYRVTFRN